ncbi:MAG TPA: DUF2442 domain-containing protein [Caulobacterales bacterium]|nr:DUF2442 domain-containing protein [Caulobacterales bacterium]
MIDLVKVLRVEALGGYRLRVHFTNGEVGEQDFSAMVAEGGTMVEPLRDPAFFARAFVQNGVPAWPNGLDLDAVALHQEMKAAGALTLAALEPG